MKEWIYTPLTEINNTLCLEHRLTKEKSIFGELGEIYLMNSSTCKARIWAKVKGVKTLANYSNGDEANIEFPIRELPKYLKLLKCPNSQAAMQGLSIKDKEYRRQW